MTSRRRKRIYTTKEQRQGLLLIRKRLALQGFQMFPVARRFRGHSLDFLAVYREDPQKMLLVQPKKKGIVRVRPYRQQGAYRFAWMQVEEGREPLPPIVWGKWLPAKDNVNGWRRFIPSDFKLPLALFTNSN